MIKYLAIFLLVALPARAATYALQCTASCVASDGTTQPPGTFLGLVLWDGVAQWTPPNGMKAVLYTGQTVYSPVQSTPTTIPTADFVSRFTSSEQASIVANSSSLVLWLQLMGYQQIDVTNPRVTSGMAALVAGNLITSARSTQILNLSVSSP